MMGMDAENIILLQLVAASLTASIIEYSTISDCNGTQQLEMHHVTTINHRQDTNTDTNIGTPR